MTGRVWKFKVSPPDAEGRVTVELPSGAEVLSFGFQDGDVVAWALVKGEKPSGKSLRTFILVTTGYEFPVAGWFVQTLMSRYGMVWHVFDPVVAPSNRPHG